LAPATNTPTFTTVLLLTTLVLLLFIPFLFMGFTISWIIATQQQRVGVVYGANMLGSGLGAVFFLFIFNRFPGEIAPFINALLILTASLIAIESRRQLAQWIPLVALTVPLLFLGDYFQIQLPNYKLVGRIENPKRDLVFSGWSSVSKLDIFRNPDRIIGRGTGLWGISRRYFEERKPLPRRLGVAIDGSAYTTILGHPFDPAFFDYLPSTFVYQLGKKFERSLHIGAGGGMDLLAARYYGTEKIDGVEINPLIVRAMTTELADFSGRIYDGGMEGVQVHLGEGRSFLERTDDTYDLIQLSGVDTSASSEAGAFALAENYLYTTEAFVSYLEHLRPGGLLTLTRLHLPDRQGRKTYSLRLACIVRSALRELGIDPEGRVFFMLDAPKGRVTVIAVQLEPFTPEQIEQGLEYAKLNRFGALVIPGQRLDNIYEEFLYASPQEYRRLVGDYPYYVDSPTDDRPFIFELQRLSTVFQSTDWPVRSSTITGQEILIVLLIELGFLGVLLLILPLRWLAKRKRLQIPWRANVYFSMIGFAYISVEIVLAQRMVLYLGHPSYALSVVIAGMLVFSGVASALSDRLGDKQRWMLFLLVPTLAITGITLAPVLHLSLQASFGVRLAVSIAYFAPLAFLMGFPFPFGLRKVDESAVPFLWGVNGFFSVVGSVLAVIVSINFGFTWVFGAASIAYVIAASILAKREAQLSAA
ncbi:MAG: hypothetical protein V3T33_09210, partial [Myxococcota bacterium]